MRAAVLVSLALPGAVAVGTASTGGYSVVAGVCPASVAGWSAYKVTASLAACEAECADRVG